MSEEENVPRISRRQFLKIAGLGLSAALTGCKVEEFTNNPTTTILPEKPIQTSDPTQTAVPQHEIRFLHELPDAPPASISLKQTATTLELTGQQSSFQEEIGFTKEFFESVRRSTFILRVTGQKGADVWGGRSTCWLIRAQEDDYYLVTNRHTVQVPSGFNFSGLSLWRPGYDNEVFVPERISIASPTSGLDIAVLRLKGKYHTRGSIESLKWEDNILLQKGDKALIVGFPGEFADPDSPMNSYTLGSVITIEKDTNPNTYQWYARALVNGGISGSPAVLNRDGDPVVVGIINGRNDWNLKVGDYETQKQPVVTGSPLIINSLLAAFK